MDYCTSPYTNSRISLSRMQILVCGQTTKIASVVHHNNRIKKSARTVLWFRFVAEHLARLLRIVLFVPLAKVQTNEQAFQFR